MMTDPTSGNLGGPEEACIGEGVDPVLLAEFLDGELPGRDRARVEDHLAACRACRELAMEAGLAIAEQKERSFGPSELGARNRSKEKAPGRDRGGPRGWLAVAASILVVLTAGFFLKVGRGSPWDERLADVGVERSIFQRADADVRARARRALQGEIREIHLFDAFLDLGERPALRTSSAADGPRPISPRWTATTETSPTLRCDLPSPVSWAEADGLRGEIFLVDDQEELVATFSFEVRSPAFQAPVELAWPDDLAALEPEKAYAWKINLLLNEEWVASEYVPFRVVDPTVAELSPPVDDDEFLSGVELASRGLYEAALARLSQLALGPEGQVLQKRLIRTILERQHLPEELVEKEVSRWSARSP